MNEGKFGPVERETKGFTFETHPVEDSDYFLEDYEAAEPVEIDGVFVTLGEFQEVMENIEEPEDRGYIPDEEELYALLDEDQRKLAREHGCTWSIEVELATYNFKSRIGSDEEDELMDHETRIASIGDRVTFVEKFIVE